MKLSKEYLIERLKTTSVEDLALELAERSQQEYNNNIDLVETAKKYESMLRPLAPVTATDFMESLGIHVVRVK